MKGFLLDTNCISELVRVRPDQRVVDWISSIDEEWLFLSVLTLGEIRKGLEALPRVKRRAGLETWLSELKIRFTGRLLPIDDAVADRWGVLAAQARREGKTLSVIDGLLGATALHFDLTIVTRNVSDFSVGQVATINPWKV
jgi:predicted nucleic acid-binding protein